MIHVLSLTLGAIGWSFTEYCMHRFDGHGMKGKTRFSKEHLAHHSDSSYFAPTYLKVIMAAVVATPMVLGLWALVGAYSFSFTAGFLALYTGYEVLHRRIHTHAPPHAYGRWARRHHFHHHHNAPNLNHGVTSDVWDRVFGTLAPVETVRMPRKHAPVWMLDDSDGSLLAAFSGEYRLAGRPRKA